MTESWMFGEFVHREPRRALSGAAVELPALALVAHWRRCGLTADWLAAFMAYDFEHRDAATSVLATVINELLENAIKFCANKSDPVRLSVRHYGDVFRIEAHNSADARRTEALRAHLERIEREDVDALFASLVERASDKGSPGVGLVILQRDYGASLGVHIGPADASGAHEIGVQVTLRVEEVELR